MAEAHQRGRASTYTFGILSQEAMVWLPIAKAITMGGERCKRRDW